nr:MAG TPA: hypothetical protein [Caudoviricetes sp.]
MPTFDTAIRKNLPAVVSQTDFSPICHQNALACVWNWLAQKFGHRNHLPFESV